MTTYLESPAVTSKEVLTSVYKSSQLHIRKQTLLYQRLKSLFRRNSGARHENVQERTVEHCAKEVLSNSADWKHPI